jgi:hypothetical protein
MVSGFAQALGSPIDYRTAGKNTLRLLGLFNPLLAEFVEMSYLFEQPLRVGFDKAGRQFGLSATELSESIQQTVAWHCTHQEQVHSLQTQG